MEGSFFSSISSFFSLVSNYSVFWEGWSQDFLSQNQLASSKGWKLPGFFFSVLWHLSDDAPLASLRAQEGGWNFLCPSNLASIRRWKSQAQVDWPSTREDQSHGSPACRFLQCPSPSSRSPQMVEMSVAQAVAL